MRFRYGNLLYSVILLVMWISPITSVFAQNATGSITGTVTDPNNAFIANATVTVTNNATGAARKVTTRNEGNYSVENLFPGEYEVKVEAQGFTTQIMVLTVQVGNTTTSNFSMRLGVTSQTVEVMGGAPILNTSDSSLGGVVTQKQIDNLPLNGRSFLSVAGLEPGVTISYQATSGVLNQNDFFQVSVAGAPSYMTTISVDGSRANDRITGGTSQNFSSETVQEFQIGTIGFDLSSGTISAGSVNIVSRSGGNDYHGSGFFYFRDHNMAAFPGLSRSCQGLAGDNPLCRVPDARKRLDDPFFVRRQYGGTLGGPVKKNKLFFFANYERSAQVGAQPVSFANPLLFGFNHIGQVPFDQHLIGTRVDYRISDKHTAFVRGNIDKNDSVAGTGLESTWIASSNYSYQTQFGLTSVLRPTLVSDFRFSYSYFRNRLFPPSQEMCESLASDPRFCFGVGSTQINFGSAASGFLVSVGNNANTPQDRHPRTYQYTENISWSKGAHRVRFGGNYEHIYSHGSWFRNYAGTFTTFDPARVQAINPELYLTLPASLKAGYTGPPPTFAELLQLPVTGQLTVGIGDGGQPVAYLYDELTTNNHIRLYIQDAWQIRPSFTINYGLAWSFEDNQPYHFLDRPEYLRPTGIGLEKIPQDYNNFDPALGFAWSVNDKTVIRSSVSLHHSSGNRNYLKLQDQILIGPAGSGLVSAGSSSVPNPFAQPGPLFRPGQPGTLNFDSTAGPVDFRGQDMMNQLAAIRGHLVANSQYNGQDLSIRNIEVRKQAPAAGSEAIFDATHRTPYMIHVNAGVQRQIMNSLSVSADFVMRRGVKFGQNEFMLDDINRWNRFSGYQLLPTGTANPLPFRNPVIPACSTSRTPPPNLEPNDPKDQCSLGPIFYAVPGILSRYTALQVKVDKRFSRGFQFTGAYALSRFTTFNGNTFTSYTDHGENFGLSGATPKHMFTFSGIWELPAYAGDQRLLRGILNGWQLSSIVQMRSRDINSVTLGTFDLEGDGLYIFRIPGTGINSFGRGQDADDIRRLVDQYNAKYPAAPDTRLAQIGRANRDAVGAPFPYINLPENFSSGDSFLTHDLRVTRTFSITEKLKLNLIAEGFNIFNIANLSGHTGSLSSAAYIRPTATTPGRPNPDNVFGQPTNRVSPIFGTGGPRALQFAARLTF
jgi:Carboxypeptidase regulatory-like domain